MMIDVLLHELIVTGTLFSATKLPPVCSEPGVDDYLLSG